MKRQIKILLGIAIFMQISCYFLPFMRSDKGFYFFKKGINALFDWRVNEDNWYRFYVFLAPLASFPILLIGLFKSFSNSMMKKIKIGLFIFSFAPVLVSILLMSQESYAYKSGFLGYSFWAISFCLMYGVLFFKKQINENTNPDDLSNHLVGDEP